MNIVNVVQSIRYINLDELFEGLGELLDTLAETGIDVAFGDAEYTLVAPDLIIETLEDADDEEENKEYKFTEQFDELRSRVKNIPQYVLINLEH